MHICAYKHKTVGATLFNVAPLFILHCGEKGYLNLKVREITPRELMHRKMQKIITEWGNTALQKKCRRQLLIGVPVASQSANTPLSGAIHRSKAKILKNEEILYSKVWKITPSGPICAPKNTDCICIGNIRIKVCKQAIYRYGQYAHRKGMSK